MTRPKEARPHAPASIDRSCRSMDRSVGRSVGHSIDGSIDRSSAWTESESVVHRTIYLYMYIYIYNHQYTVSIYPSPPQPSHPPTPVLDRVLLSSLSFHVTSFVDSSRLGTRLVVVVSRSNGGDRRRARRRRSDPRLHTHRSIERMPTGATTMDEDDRARARFRATTLDDATTTTRERTTTTRRGRPRMMSGRMMKRARSVNARWKATRSERALGNGRAREERDDDEGRGGGRRGTGRRDSSEKGTIGKRGQTRERRRCGKG